MFRVHLSQSFQRSVRRLRRRYRHLTDDLEAAIEWLLLQPQLGVVIRGLPAVRKLRIPSTDMDRGKSGGFRLLYTIDRPSNRIILLFLYAKPERENVSAAEIETLLREALTEEGS